MSYQFTAYSAEATKDHHLTLEPEKENSVEFFRTNRKKAMQ